jgi:RHH-type transcriptional regulator, proline utilization regulon repressor / proline dehydrogenase / delta 1-pyrroline-5-carboxylate dehydrogenase
MSQTHSLDVMTIRNPAHPDDVVGILAPATQSSVHEAITAVHVGSLKWSMQPVDTRARILEAFAELLQQRMAELMALLIREAGKTRVDAMNEVREAIDFCRYYAQQARALMLEQVLPGPTGEFNALTLHPRGVFACISPWNFPLAIFTGQIAAALVTGNGVLAKPAPQTPLIATLAVRLMHQAGVPKNALALLPGGPQVGEWLVRDAHINGIAFTGSTATARHIARSLLQDEQRPLTTLIAETGGINAMIVDSTALLEQMVRDVITSAFHSAGQRCSALRLLCLQQDVYDRALMLLQGAMAELQVGDPQEEGTDVGPLIDANAQTRIQMYLDAHAARVIYQTPLPKQPSGWYIPPTLLAVDKPQDVQQEVFGPVLHVCRWRAGELHPLIETINASGYGLTLGLHTRLDTVMEQVRQRARIGNVYINRSMIGAVVGSQPFGGEGLSGTGPKAGGPHYLLRFCVERTVSIDTTAAGGNASLLSLDT